MSTPSGSCVPPESGRRPRGTVRRALPDAGAGGRRRVPGVVHVPRTGDSPAGVGGSHLHDLRHRSATFFAPVTSATGAMELKGFWEYSEADLEGVWTKNASKCPALVKWVESTGARFCRVQLLRMSPNTLRECRWGCTWITTTSATRRPMA